MQKWLVDVAGDEIYQQATVRNRPGEKEDDDVKMISAVK